MSDRIEKLFSYLDSKALEPFVWGKNDCVHFVLGALNAQGAKYNKIGFKTYRTERAAARVLAELGGLERAVTLALGDPLPTASMAKRGDVAITHLGALTVCTGLQFVGIGETGLKQCGMDSIKMAWGVECLN